MKNKILIYLSFILVSIAVIATEQHIVEYTTFEKIAKTTTSHRPVIMPLRQIAMKQHLQVPPNDSTMRRDSFAPRDAFFMSRRIKEWDRKILSLPAFIFFMTLRKSFISALFILLAGGFIKIALQWFKTEREKEILEKEKLNAELGFLKSQVNPHFLFNSLNSIYSLAHKKADETETAILQLSQMMRYMIYDSNTNNVLLDKELEYLQNYIDLKKLRLAGNIDVRFNVSGNTKGLIIEPMLLIPFIENAFKHGISYAENCYINISITCTDDTLKMEVSNKLIKRAKDEVGGLGLENVRKRLNLLYPDSYTLDIATSDNTYTTTLILALKNIAHD
ncbi:MAG: histidine kinase [Filimonas sp.]|nr:histidine kinase [Filimonas sp.]